MNILLSIKPCYAERILEGEKKYEFRRRIFRKDVESIYIYSTSPVRRVVGMLRIEKILEGTVEMIWEECSSDAGLSREEYFCYFENKEKAFAIKIKEVQAFDEPIDPYVVYQDFVPPQSFCYVSSDFHSGPILDNLTDQKKNNKLYTILTRIISLFFDKSISRLRDLVLRWIEIKNVKTFRE
jgi:predicted transcriptional regulator